MWVRSSSSLSRIANCWPLPCLPQGFRTWVGMAPSHKFRLRRSGRLVDSGSSEQESARSVRSFLSLHHILAFVQSELRVHPCSLAHCDAPWLVALRPCRCLITAGLATMDGPQLASSDESQLCCWPSRGGTAPVAWLRGVFPCFDHSSFMTQHSFGFSASVYSSGSSR